MSLFEIFKRFKVKLPEVEKRKHLFSLYGFKEEYRGTTRQNLALERAIQKDPEPFKRYLKSFRVKEPEVKLPIQKKPEIKLKETKPKFRIKLAKEKPKVKLELAKPSPKKVEIKLAKPELEKKKIFPEAKPAPKVFPEVAKLTKEVRSEIKPEKPAFKFPEAIPAIKKQTELATKTLKSKLKIEPKKVEPQITSGVLEAQVKKVKTAFNPQERVAKLVPPIFKPKRPPLQAQQGLKPEVFKFPGIYPKVPTFLPKVVIRPSKIEEKRDIENIIERDKNILVDTLKTDEPYLWEERLQKKIVKPEIEIIFSPEEERELKEDIKHNDKEIERLKEEILAFREGELGRLGIREEPQIWIELGKIDKDLENYNRQRQAALLARNILTKVSEELNEELLKVINDEKMGVSAYFSYITGGKYQKVEWREGSIYIQDKGGTSYSAKDLSTGTLDQLLFSLRLSILKGALPEGGFFVLDDAFLTSDYERRRKLVKVCRDLSSQKWQILYFTVDDHLRDLFSQICGIKPKVL